MTWTNAYRNLYWAVQTQRQAFCNLVSRL